MGKQSSEDRPLENITSDRDVASFRHLSIPTPTSEDCYVLATPRFKPLPNHIRQVLYNPLEIAVSNIYPCKSVAGGCVKPGCALMDSHGNNLRGFGHGPFHGDDRFLWHSATTVARGPSRAKLCESRRRCEATYDDDRRRRPTAPSVIRGFRPPSLCPLRRDDAPAIGPARGPHVADIFPGINRGMN